MDLSRVELRWVLPGCASYFWWQLCSHVLIQLQRACGYWQKAELFSLQVLTLFICHPGKDRLTYYFGGELMLKIWKFSVDRCQISRVAWHRTKPMLWRFLSAYIFHFSDKATIGIVNFTEVITASASWSQHLSLEEVLLKMYEIETDEVEFTEISQVYDLTPQSVCFTTFFSKIM